MASVEESSTLPRPPAVEVAAAAAEFKRRMMGSDRNSLNLGAVRGRAEDLRKTLDQIVHALQYNAQHIHWHDALDKFAVVNVQYQNLVEQLRPMLKLWAVHPKSVNQQNAAILPIMLATKSLPEMDADAAQMLQHAADAQLAGNLELLTSVEDAHNALVRHLTQLGEPGSDQGLLDAKSPIRLELAKQMRSQPSAPSTQAAAGGSRKRAPVTGVEALLAAVTDGTSLRQR